MALYIARVIRKWKEMSRPNGDQSFQFLSLSTVTVTQQKSWNGKAEPWEHAMFSWGLLS